MHTYHVTAVREGRWWVFEIPELGTGGQGMSLAEVKSEAVNVAAMWCDVDPNTVEVSVTVQGVDAELAEWQAAAAEEEQARLVQTQAAQRRRAVVNRLREQRWSSTDIARLLGVSKQRIHQLEKA